MSSPMLLDRRTALALFGSLAAPMMLPRPARAEAWPAKPVRYINVFPPGGPTDTLSRIVCNQLAAGVTPACRSNDTKTSL